MVVTVHALVHDQDMCSTQRAFYILSAGCFAWTAALVTHAQAMPSFGDCAKRIEQQGYQIDDMEQRGAGYEVDALKEGGRWDLRLDRNCRVVDERPD